MAASGDIPSDFRVARNVGLPEPPVPPSWTDAYRRAVSDPAFLSTPQGLGEIAPGPYRRAPSLPTLESYPKHEFWLSVHPGGRLRMGSTLSAAFFLHPPIAPSPSNWGTDAYVAALLPTGEWYAFVWPGQWRRFNVVGPAYPPAAKAGLAVKREVRGMAFVQGLGAGRPQGPEHGHGVLAIVPGHGQEQGHSPGRQNLPQQVLVHGGRPDPGRGGLRKLPDAIDSPHDL